MTRFVSVGVGVSQRIPSSVLARNPRDRKRMREGRSQRRGKDSQQKRREEKDAVGRRELGGEQGSQQKSERRLLEPVDLGRIDQCEKMSQHF